MNAKKIGSCIFIALAISGCGGSSNDSATVTNNTSGIGKGGTLAEPTPIVSSEKYSVTPNNFYNHFLYNGNVGDTLFLKMDYDLPFSLLNRGRCYNSRRENSFATFDVYSKQGDFRGVYCYDEVFRKTTNAESIVFELQDSKRGNGILFTSIVKGDSAINTPMGILRSPSNPIALQKTNTLDRNSFFNYFKYTAKAGEKINISIALDVPLTTQQKARCMNHPSSLEALTRLSTIFTIYDSSYNTEAVFCNEKNMYTFKRDGTYIFYFNFEGAGNEDGGGIGTGNFYFESLGVNN